MLNKHSIHHDITIEDVDHKGKDTYRHYQAGADVVVLSAARMTAMFKRQEQPQPIQKIEESYLEGVDIILAEGFKEKDKPKIEIVRQEIGDELLCSPQENNLVAIVSDKRFEIGLPCFALDDYPGVACFLTERFLK